jgi:hypothetical protein
MSYKTPVPGLCSRLPDVGMPARLQMHGTCQGCGALLIAVYRNQYLAQPFDGLADRPLPDCPLRLQMHATCLGMEAVAVAVAQENSLLETFDGTNNPSTVKLVPGGEVSKSSSTGCWSVSCSN